MILENLDSFIPEDSDLVGARPTIPKNAYKPVKRCPNCQSVYLTDTKCEACGRSMLYHPVGEPFGPKSLYGYKERYCEALPTFIKYFNAFENKSDASAKSYVRHLTKRFDDLLIAFGETGAIETNDRRFFYVEMLELIDELLRYGVKSFILQQKIEGATLDTGTLLSQELLFYLQETQKENHLTKPWQEQILGHRIVGLRVEYILKVILITTTVVAIAVTYYGFINSLIGK